MAHAPSAPPPQPISAPLAPHLTALCPLKCVFVHGKTALAAHFWGKGAFVSLPKYCHFASTACRQCISSQCRQTTDRKSHGVRVNGVAFSVKCACSCILGAFGPQGRALMGRGGRVCIPPTCTSNGWQHCAHRVWCIYVGDKAKLPIPSPNLPRVNFSGAFGTLLLSVHPAVPQLHSYRSKKRGRRRRRTRNLAFASRTAITVPVVTGTCLLCLALRSVGGAPRGKAVLKSPNVVLSRTAPKDSP